MDEEKTILVTGRSAMQVGPDSMKIVIDAVVSDKSSEVLMEKASSFTNSLKEMAIKAGMDEDDLKIVNYKYGDNYKTITGKDGRSKNVKDGKKIDMGFSVLLPIGAASIGPFIDSVAPLSEIRDLQTLFVPSNEEELKTEAAVLAAKDALKKATAIASSLYMDLGDIVSIDYGNHTIPLSGDPEDCAKAYCESSAFVGGATDFVPETTVISGCVNIRWKIHRHEQKLKN